MATFHRAVSPWSGVSPSRILWGAFFLIAAQLTTAIAFAEDLVSGQNAVGLQNEINDLLKESIEIHAHGTPEQFANIREEICRKELSLAAAGFSKAVELAQKSCGDALGIYLKSKSTNDLTVGLAGELVGDAFAAGGSVADFGRAIGFYHGADAIFRAQGRQDYRANIAIKEADIFINFAFSDYRENAINEYEFAREYFTLQRDPAKFAYIQSNLGLLYSDRTVGGRAKNVDIAIANIEDAEKIFTKDKWPSQWESCELNISVAFLKRENGNKNDNIENGIRRLYGLISYAKDSQKESLRAQAEINLGDAYMQRLLGDRADNIDRAIAALSDAVSVAGFSDGDRRLARLTLATTYLWRIRGERRENIERAIANYKIVIETAGDNKLLQAIADENLGVALGQRQQGPKLENLHAALKALADASEVYDLVGDKLSWSRAQINVGSTWLHEGSADGAARAKAAFLGALGWLSSTTTPTYWADAEGGLSESLWNGAESTKSSDVDAAIDASQKALSIYTADTAPRENMRISWALASKLMALGRTDAAEPLLLNATQAADVLIGAGLDEAETRDILSVVQGAHALLAYIEASKGDVRGALTSFDRGRARLIRVSFLDDDANLSQAEKTELRTLRAEIRVRENHLHTGPATAASAPSIDEIDGIGKLREHAYALYMKGTQNSPAMQGLGDIERGEVVVVPILTRYGSKILIVKSADDITVVPLPSTIFNSVEEEVQQWTTDYQLGDFDAAVGHFSDRRNEALAMGIRRALEVANVPPQSRVVILPDGRASVLPISLAASTAAPARALLDDFEISFVPSFTALSPALERAKIDAPKTLALVANPNADVALNGIIAEGKFVASEFGDANTSIARGENGISAVFRVFERRQYWHIAGHASFDWDDPGASGIQLSGKIRLTVRSILEHRDALGSPRLVTLSACETGVSETERNADEFTGLPSAFIQAGATAVLASLWPVKDVPTALLMGKFYDLHIQKNERPSAALRDAQLWLRQATRNDLIEFIAGKRDQNIITHEDASKLISAIPKLSPAPFGDVKYWGAFVIYGV